MYFGSFLGCEIHNKKYTESDIIELIKDYRHMSKYQKIQLEKEVISYCNPNNFNKKGMNKNNKRDYHNWKNEAEQIYMLLNQTVLYEIIDKNKLVVKVGEGALFENEAKLKRSYTEKKKYFENHDIQKTPGFEFHHIVSLFMADNKNEYSSLDVWQNMIYIDAYMHSKLHDTCDTYFEIKFENNNLIIEDIECTNKNKSLKLIKDKNILYNTKNIKIMKTYNKGYLESLIDITNK